MICFKKVTKQLDDYKSVKESYFSAFPIVERVPQAHAYVIERLGTYHVTWSTGLHVKIPFIDKISKKVSLKEQVIDFPPQHGVNKTIPSCKS